LPCKSTTGGGADAEPMLVTVTTWVPLAPTGVGPKSSAAGKTEKIPTLFAFTTRVKVCVAAGPTPLLAVIVIG
jgi:hypothetical protein